MSDCEQENETTSLGNSIDIASMKIFKKTYELSLDKNVVTSPLGALTLLSLYASGSGGKNREEILTLLGSTDYYKKIFESYSQISERFSSMDPNCFVMANKILMPKNSIEDGEYHHAARMFGDEGYLNKSQYEKAVADTMNEWSSKLSEQPMDPVSESDFDPDSVVALLNVIFFKGHWCLSFNANNTKEEDFHIDPSTTVKKPMMHLLQSFYYHENEDMAAKILCDNSRDHLPCSPRHGVRGETQKDNAQTETDVYNEMIAKIIELPYKESDFRMVVVLPDEVDGLPAVLEKVSEKGLLEDIVKLRSVRSKVNLSMPKFETRSMINVSRTVGKVSRIFGSSGPKDFNGQYRTRATQEAFIKVDEEGATAGADLVQSPLRVESANIEKLLLAFIVDKTYNVPTLYPDTKTSSLNLICRLVMSLLCDVGRVKVLKSIKFKPPKQIHFKVDRPFLYIILHDDIVLFVGTYTH